MSQPRITSIHMTTTEPRKKPKAGDERHIGGVLHIRQQQRVPEGMPHAGAYLVSGSRPVWEWVPKGSDRDRAAPKLKTCTLVVNGTGPCPLSERHKAIMRDSWHETLTDTHGREYPAFDPQVRCDDHGEQSALLTFKAPAKLVETLAGMGVRIQVKP